MSKIIGIDLGTTNSVVAVMEGGEPTVKKILAGTRVHQMNASKPLDLTNLENFLLASLEYANEVAVAVGSDGGECVRVWLCVCMAVQV